jgi:vacuolar-type H+-ATPase subunit D/Vma8
MKMKNILIAVTALVWSLSMHAQTGNDYLELTREVLKVEKKAAVTEAMQLSEAESQPFWNLYNEYQNALYVVQNKRIDIIKDYAEHFETLSDEKADELWMGSMKYRSELLKLKKKYYARFKKVVSPGKAARFMQLENKIETLIDAQLALDIPLIEPR